MIKYTLCGAKNKLRGQIALPSSKSISNRLLLIRALSPGGFDIDRLSDSDDTRVLQEGLQSTADVVDIGHAGTSMRFLTAYFAATGRAKTITGSERMKNRPIGELVDTLNQLGADISYLEKQGFPPIRTSGKPLSGNTVEIDGGVSSQFISAMLLVAPVLPEGLKIRIAGDSVSSSYIKMTLELMNRAGAKTSRTGNVIVVEPQEYRSGNITVERDWSAASYWYEAVSLSEDAEILLEGVSDNSLQGDSVAAQIFESLGVRTEYSDAGALLTKTKPDRSFRHIDFIEAPDLVQTVAVALCMQNIPFRFEGVKTLKVKETDRIAALRNELLKTGYCIEEPAPGVIEWTGKRTSPAKDICISTYHDHRMAMAFAPAAIVFPGLQIEDPGVVSKSYPRFWDDLEKVGFTVEK